MGRSGGFGQTIVGSGAFYNKTSLLNELGEQGWEVVGVVGDDSSGHLTLLLKRPRS